MDNTGHIHEKWKNTISINTNSNEKATQYSQRNEECEIWTNQLNKGKENGHQAWTTQLIQIEFQKSGARSKEFGKHTINGKQIIVKV